jgi:hypothetical protein
MIAETGGYQVRISGGRRHMGAPVGHRPLQRPPLDVRITRSINDAGGSYPWSQPVFHRD